MSNALLELMRQGESGAAGYNAYNRGTYTGSDGKQHIRGPDRPIDFSRLTLAQVQDLQHLGRRDPDRVFAIGKYQIIPDTLDAAVRSLKLNGSEPFTPALQDRIFSDYLLVKKQPGVHAYITGQPGATLERAQYQLSTEWASFPDPTRGGASHYGGANQAHISLQQSAAALNAMRAHYSQCIAHGMAPAQAWNDTAGGNPTQAQGPTPVAATTQAPASQARPPAAPATAIYAEAVQHFLANGNQFEYGRSDMRMSNNEGVRNRTTDASRNERDMDGDGLKGVDCSSFVWRALKNAGYDVPVNTAANPFTTHALFNGHRLTDFASQNFDVISAADARRDRGDLKPGDILLFKDKDGTGQHVGIFKGYDANGHIRFIGSQVSTGPAEAGAAPGTYWNGRDFEIVGALRAKPEFQVRAPLHTQNGGQSATTQVHAPQAPAAVRATPAADADGVLQMGEKGPAVATLQRRLFELDYRAKDGRPLKINGDFGGDTLFALQQFQREHGLEGKGVAGPKTAAALDRAEAALMTHPGHPQHALYEQALTKVQEAEKAKGIPVGPHSERVAAALVVECLREGLTRIDRVAISDTGKLAWAIEDRPGGRESGLGRTDGISLAQAANQPLAESSQQAHQVAVNVREQHQADLQRRAVQPAPAVAH